MLVRFLLRILLALLTGVYILDNVKQFLLTRMGYKPENIKLLADKEGSDGQPTKANILGAVTVFSEGLRPGDYLWLHFSGHVSLK